MLGVFDLTSTSALNCAVELYVGRLPCAASLSRGGGFISPALLCSFASGRSENSANCASWLSSARSRYWIACSVAGRGACACLTERCVGVRWHSGSTDADFFGVCGCGRLCWLAFEGDVGGVGLGTGKLSVGVGRTNVASVGVTRRLEGGETLRGREFGCGRSRMLVYVGVGVGEVDFGRGDCARGFRGF